MDKSDILSDVLATLRLSSDLYFRADFGGPFSVEVPAERRLIRFHLVRHGTCWIRTGRDLEAAQLGEGDLAIVPNGALQILSDTPSAQPEALADVLAASPPDADGTLRLDAGPQQVRLLCGFCSFDEDMEHPAIAALPALVVLRHQDLGAEPWLATTLKLMMLEADLGSQGMEGILSRLMETVLIQTLRRMAFANNGSENNQGYMAALKDPRLSRALMAVHGQPEEPWTIDRLATIAGMSRAQFAKRFTACVGITPIDYLTSWRLMKARRMLRDSDMAIAEIASRCGYASLPSFSRRFKTTFGVGPGGFRRVFR